MESHRLDGVGGLFIHPVENEDVMAGNGTIGLELIEDLPDVDTVVVPVGGGGLITGIASAVKQLRPGTRVVSAQPETAAAMAAALERGEPVEIDYQPTWIDGAGAKAILPGMWPYLQEVVDDAAVVTLDEVEEAVRVLAGRVRVIAEGAGALALAAALAGRTGGTRVACIVSGGNIDAAVLCRILNA
jgi:threonine dehydratase